MIPCEDDIYFKVSGVETREGKRSPHPFEPHWIFLLTRINQLRSSSGRSDFVIIYFKFSFKIFQICISLPHRTKALRWPRLDDRSELDQWKRLQIFSIYFQGLLFFFLQNSTYVWYSFTRYETCIAHKKPFCVSGQADQIGARSLDGSVIKVKMKCTLLLRGPISTSLFHCGPDGLSPISGRKFCKLGPQRCW